MIPSSLWSHSSPVSGGPVSYRRHQESGRPVNFRHGKASRVTLLGVPLLGRFGGRRRIVLGASAVPGGVIIVQMFVKNVGSSYRFIDGDPQGWVGE